MSQNWNRNPIIVAAKDSVEYIHFREPNAVGQLSLTATMAFVPFNTGYIASFAFLNPKDSPSYAIGRLISSGRVFKSLAFLEGLIDPDKTPNVIFIPFQNKDDIRAFVAQAKSAEIRVAFRNLVDGILKSVLSSEMVNA